MTSIQEFSKKLTPEMETLVRSEDNSIEGIKDKYSAMLGIVSRLKDFASGYEFKNKKEEIFYFKIIKPAFLSTLIYYQKLFHIKTHLPTGLPDDIMSFYLSELNKIKVYTERNLDFLAYYRSGSELLDEIYFVSKEPDPWLSLNTDCEPGTFATTYDHKLSRLLAYERISAFLIQEIRELHPDSAEPHVSNEGSNITWTGSKASLIELLYALQTSGVCNNGVIEVKQLANHFERLFNVKLGNFYRTFQEIRIRKMSRTSFLDHLRDTLIQRMNESDENPRY